MIAKEGDNKNKKLREFKQTPEDLDRYLQFSYCIKCGLCYSACPTAGADLRFPGPQALAQMYRYVADSRDNAVKERLNIVDNQHGVWRCHFPKILYRIEKLPVLFVHNFFIYMFISRIYV
jgi:succinate dehydrogenase/fumarate reductase iron-sulfur protein